MKIITKWILSFIAGRDQKRKKKENLFTLAVSDVNILCMTRHASKEDVLEVFIVVLYTKVNEYTSWGSNSVISFLLFSQWGSALNPFLPGNL